VAKPGCYVLLVQHAKGAENANCGGFYSVFSVGLTATLKVEEVDLKEYRTFEEAKQNIRVLIEKACNEKVSYVLKP
jgi:hypothetical protein